MAATANSAFEICKGVNDLDKVVLREAGGSSAEVYLYGGHVTSWKNDNGEELLFLSSKGWEYRLEVALAIHLILIFSDQIMTSVKYPRRMSQI